MTTITKSDKYTCQCGSSIKNDSVNIRQHLSTMKHMKYTKDNQIQIPETPVPVRKQIITEKENVVEYKMNNDEKKEKVLTKNALRVRAYRARVKAELGDEKYKEAMRLQKQTSRTATKAKTAPVNKLADNTAGFNTINYFLIGSDLVRRGIQINNKFAGVIAQVLIDVSPGSQIVSTPFNPSKIQCDELIGSKRTNLRFRLTDDKLRPVNTNGEYYSARIVIRYQIKM